MPGRRNACLSALQGLAVAGLIAVSAPHAFAAGSVESALKACAADGAPLLVERLKHCNAAISSGELTPASLALALNYRGMVFAKQKNFAAAIADFNEALRHHPGDPRAYWFRGLAYSAMGEIDRALADLDKAVVLAPKVAALYKTRSSIHSKRKDHAREIEDLTTAIGLVPRPHTEYALRGFAYADAGERDKAIADYKKALEIDPGDELARQGLFALNAATPEALQLPPGKCSETDVPDAERAESCAAAIASGTLSSGALTIAYCNLGYSLTELGEFDQVVTISDTALRNDANSACAYLNRGRAWYYKHDLDRAIADYTQAISLDPSLHEAYASRGTAYFDRREFKLALADYTTAIDAEPSVAMYRSDRGNTYYMMGDYNRAIADLMRAIELDPNSAKIHSRRGYAFLATRDFARAEADFTRSLELYPGESYTRRGLELAQQRRTPEEASPDRKGTGALSFEDFRRLVNQPAAQ